MKFFQLIFFNLLVFVFESKFTKKSDFSNIKASTTSKKNLEPTNINSNSAIKGFTFNIENLDQIFHSARNQATTIINKQNDLKVNNININNNNNNYQANINNNQKQLVIPVPISQQFINSNNNNNSNLNSLSNKVVTERALIKRKIKYLIKRKFKFI